jgi:hypothetical protein
MGGLEPQVIVACIAAGVSLISLFCQLTFIPILSAKRKAFYDNKFKNLVKLINDILILKHFMETLSCDFAGLFTTSDDVF